MSRSDPRARGTIGLGQARVRHAGRQARCSFHVHVAGQQDLTGLHDQHIGALATSSAERSSGRATSVITAPGLTCMMSEHPLARPGVAVTMASMSGSASSGVAATKIWPAGSHSRCRPSVRAVSPPLGLDHPVRHRPSRQQARAPTRSRRSLDHHGLAQQTPPVDIGDPGSREQRVVQSTAPRGAVAVPGRDRQRCQRPRSPRRRPRPS